MILELKVERSQHHVINYRQKKLINNGVRSSNKLKNTAAPSSGGLFSLSTGAAENFISSF